MPAVLGNLMDKMGVNNPASGPTPVTPAVPAGLQKGNTSSSILQWLSGKLGGGDPSEEQNNTYAKGKIDEYMANQQAVKARAQQKGAQAAQRELKKGMSQIQPPQLGSPGTGQTPSTPLQQLWQTQQSQQPQQPFTGKISGQ